MGKQSEDERAETAQAMYTVEEVVRELSVTPRTLHYYEEFGLVEPAGRTAGGHRLYDDASVEKLRRVLRLKDALGYSLQEIKEILDQERVLDQLKATLHEDMGTEQREQLLVESMRLLEQVVANIDERLKRLQTIRSSFAERLERIRDSWSHMHSETGANPPRTKGDQS